MRFLGIFGLSAASLWLAACGDDGGGPIVGESIAWRLGGASYVRHVQAAVKQNFKVSCSRSSAGLTVRIEDPGFKGDPGVMGPEGDARPGGSIQITNGNPQGNVCNVKVNETTEYGGPILSHIGSCGTACTLVGQYNYNGWDFSGTLTCSTLKLQGSGAAAQVNYTLSDPITSMAVQIDVDNCGG